MASLQLSVVIVTYNNIGTIRDCLTSLAAALRGLSYEIHLIDNASRDGTARWLASTREPGLPAFQFTANESNLGFTAAVNFGLRKCRGERILLLNPDVILEDDTLVRLNACLDGGDDIGAAAPQLRYPDGRVQSSCRRFPRKTHLALDLLRRASRWHMSDFDHTESRDVDQPQGAFLLVRGRVLRRIGLLDPGFPMFFSDVDWCRRIGAAGWRIRFCVHARARHLKGASVYPCRDRMIVSSHRSFVRYFSKYDRNAADRLGTALFHFVLLAATVPRILWSRLRVESI